MNSRPEDQSLADDAMCGDERSTERPSPAEKLLLAMLPVLAYCNEGTESNPSGHVSPAFFCRVVYSFAELCYGSGARDHLREVGLVDGESVGRVVWSLVERGMMQTSAEDSLAGFAGQFTLERLPAPVRFTFEQPPERRKRQFSLAALFGLVTLMAVTFGFGAWLGPFVTASLLAIWLSGGIVAAAKLSAERDAEPGAILFSLTTSENRRDLRAARKLLRRHKLGAQLNPRKLPEGRTVYRLTVPARHARAAYAILRGSK